MDGIAGIGRTDLGKKTAEFRETRTDNILAQQDTYQVGVDRFSIPSAGLPFAIIDTSIQDHRMAFYYATARAENQGASPTSFCGGYGRAVNINGEGLMLNQALEDINLPTAYAGLPPIGDYQKVANSANLAHISIDKNCKVIEIQNETEVQEVMNAGVNHSFTQQALEFNSSNYNGSLSTFPATLNRLGKMAIKEVVNVSLQNRALTATNYQGVVLTLGDSTFVAGTLNPQKQRQISSNTATPPKLFTRESMLTFYAVVENIESVADANGNYGHLENLRLTMIYKRRNGIFEEIPLMANLGEINKWNNEPTQQGGTINNFKNRLVLTPTAPISIKKLVQKGLLEKGNQGSVRTFLARPTIDDDFYVNALSSNLDGLAETELRLYNDGDAGLFTIGRIRLVMANVPTECGDNTAINVVKQTPFCETGSLFPTFNYDEALKKFSFTSSANFYRARGGVNFPASATELALQPTTSNNIYLSYDLASLFRFTYLDVGKNLTTGKIAFFGTSQVEIAPFSGSNIIEPRGRGIDGKCRCIYLDTSHYDTKSLTSISNQEVQQSAFERKVVRQILIQSTTMTINGEFEEGRSTIKILTDFEPDVDEPYTIFQFSAKPLTRYYPLRSTLPLRDVGLKIMYNDKFGTTRPFILNQGDTATIKLEFRPNNMIYNYE